MILHILFVVGLIFLAIILALVILFVWMEIKYPGVGGWIDDSDK